MQLQPIKYTDRADWLAKRRQYIGGSDMAALLGMSRYKTPVDLWLEKTGRQPGQAENEAMRWGHIHEAAIAREYAVRTGRRVENCNAILVNPAWPHLSANVDRLIWQGERKPYYRGEVRTDTLLECKTVSERMAGAWGEPGSDEIPLPYLCQTQQYLGITGAQYCDVAALFGGNRLEFYVVNQSPETWANMADIAEAWWRDYVERDTPPPPINVADVASLFPRSQERRVVASVETTQAALMYAECQARAKAIEAEQEEWRNRLAVAFGDADTLVDMAGNVLATWKSAKPSHKTDWKAVAAEIDAAIVAKHTAETPGSRRLLVKVSAATQTERD